MGLSVPRRGIGRACTGQKIGSPEYNQTVQTEQNGRCARDSFVGPLALRFDPEMGAGFCEGDFDLPSPDEQSDDLGRLQRDICAEEGLWISAPFRITDQDPADRCRRVARAIPDCDIRSDFKLLVLLMAVPGRNADPVPNCYRV